LDGGEGVSSGWFDGEGHEGIIREHGIRLASLDFQRKLALKQR